MKTETDNTISTKVESLEDAAIKHGKENVEQLSDYHFERLSDLRECISESFTMGANWQKEQLQPLIDELDNMKREFYLNICRAYNAGKKNMIDASIKGKDSFIASHNYFINEFPQFKTNVP